MIFHTSIFRQYSRNSFMSDANFIADYPSDVNPTASVARGIDRKLFHVSVTWCRQTPRHNGQCKKPPRDRGFHQTVAKWEPNIDIASGCNFSMRKMIANRSAEIAAGLDYEVTPMRRSSLDNRCK